jgi:hypothetical protein
MATMRRNRGHCYGWPETLVVGPLRSCQPSVSHGAETNARAMRPTCHRGLTIDRLLRQIFCTCDVSANRLRGYFIKLIVIPGPPLMLCEIFAAPAIP